MNFIRVLVEVDISEPLPPGFYIEIEEGREHWVEFKYERLPSNVCYGCGKIGHSQLICKHPGDYVEGRYGDWIRAGPHSPISPFAVNQRRKTPGTTESKTGDNFTQVDGRRTADSYLDGRLSGGRGFQRKERGSTEQGITRRVLPPATAILSGSEGGNSGPPPGFEGRKATGKFGPPLTLKQTDDFSPYKPRSLFQEEEEEEEEEEGGQRQGRRFLEMGQGSGALEQNGSGLGHASGAQNFNPLFTMGQPNFFPSPNYLQMAQGSYFSAQAQQPFVLWDNKQMEAQFLSPWGLKAQEPRKKLKISKKRSQYQSLWMVILIWGMKARNRMETVMGRNLERRRWRSISHPSSHDNLMLELSWPWQRHDSEVS
ncbi:unnamed protein product [Linum trigynum]|uniref:Zinc knuckle CX2CX4HX4C domain-containing protein n=1 Tax=Linum trigynum TaxID=586398 RepID=A0AAV2GQB9_9ROSI